MHREFAFLFLVGKLKSGKITLSSMAKLFVFGSVLSKKEIVSDVDLAVVYKEGCNLWEIKRELNALNRLIPLDIIYLSIKEERELDFLAKYGAVQLLPKEKPIIA